jgi:hypothetical protein
MDPAIAAAISLVVGRPEPFRDDELDSVVNLGACPGWPAPTPLRPGTSPSPPRNSEHLLATSPEDLEILFEDPARLHSPAYCV